MLMESLAFNHQDICIELFTSQKHRCEDALWEKKNIHILQLILLVQTMEILWDNEDTKCLRKLAVHQVFKSLSTLEALVLYLAWLFKHKMQNETQLDASLKGGSAFLGPSDNWMVTPAAEHLCCHPCRLQRLDATRRGHPGWQRHNNTKAFRSQSQLVEDDRIKNSHFPLSHCHPCWIGEKYPWTEKKKQLDASIINLYNRPTVWYYLQNTFNRISSDKYTFSDTKSVIERKNKLFCSVFVLQLCSGSNWFALTEGQVWHISTQTHKIGFTAFDSYSPSRTALILVIWWVGRDREIESKSKELE